MSKNLKENFLLMHKPPKEIQLLSPPPPFSKWHITDTHRLKMGFGKWEYSEVKAFLSTHPQVLHLTENCSYYSTLYKRAQDSFTSLGITEQMELYKILSVPFIRSPRCYHRCCFINIV